MKNDETKQDELKELHIIAEEALQDKPSNISEISLEDANRLLHELQVHQIELEMQNEELHRIQKEYEESRNRYSDLYDFAPVGYFTIDKNGIICEANLTGANLLGIERGLLIGKPLSRFIVSEDQDSLYLHRKQIFKTKERQICEIRMVKKDGTQFYAQLESMIIQNRDGNFSQCRTIISDITKRKLAEKALEKAQADLKVQVNQRTHELLKTNELLQFETTEHKRTEDVLVDTNELLETIFLTTHLMIAYMDRDFNFTRVNRAYATANGYSPEFFIGKNYFDLYPDNDNETIFSNVIKNGKPYFVYAEHFKFSKLKESDVEYWDWSLHPIKDLSENVKGLILLFLDVTERKRIEEQLQWSQKMESVGRLAAGVAHEIGNPLNAISSLAQLLQMKSNDAFVKENLELMRSHIDRINKIVRNMVDFAHPVNNKKKLIQVNNVLIVAVEMSKYDKRAKEIEIITELASNMQSVFLVEDQLSQVFTNIIFNAFDAMQGSGRLIISTKEELDKIYISFTDTGMGIKDDIVNRIFDPFFTTKESGQGTGLGLSISYGIIKSFDGEIEVQNTDNSGTTFTVMLPIKHIVEIEENG
jgi:PAS domain S-box-containing protein